MNARSQGHTATKRNKPRSIAVEDVNLEHECRFADQSSFIDSKEIKACFYYEYARESEIVRNLAAGLTPRSRTKKQRENEHGVFKTEVAKALRRSSFPTAWRSLPAEERIGLRESLADAIDRMQYTVIINIVDDLSSVGLSPKGNSSALPFHLWNLNVVAPLGAKVVRTGAFAVNLAAGPAAIGREFERWAAREIRHIHEADALGRSFYDVNPRTGEKTLIAFPTESDLLRAEPFRDPGPNSWQANLNRLGAMRWQYYCVKRGRSFKTASQDPELARAQPIGYRRPSDFNKECKRAAEIFSEMFDCEKPLHSSGGWPPRHVRIVAQTDSP